MNWRNASLSGETGSLSTNYSSCWNCRAVSSLLQTSLSLILAVLFPLLLFFTMFLFDLIEIIITLMIDKVKEKKLDELQKPEEKSCEGRFHCFGEKCHVAFSDNEKHD